MQLAPFFVILSIKLKKRCDEGRHVKRFFYGDLDQRNI